jgi:DNA-binding MarR family transcriptional regulator
MRPNLVRNIQRDYPQIYLTCHVDHVRSVSTPYRLSAKDSSLLAHLDEKQPISAGVLAKHLGVVASTLSAAIQRLATLGYLTRTRQPRDRRNIDLRLTAKGAEAMAATSVLDSQRIAGMLATLRPAHRRAAVAGLALLARASRTFRLSTKGKT